MVLKVRTTDILAGGGVTIGKGTRGAPALFLCLGVLIRCVPIVNPQQTEHL